MIHPALPSIIHPAHPFMVHRVIPFDGHCILPSITTEHLKPLHTLQGWDFIDAWFQCVEAHYLAWTHGIHHQDPSLENLMYRHRRGGEICPVLSDWDLANDSDWDLASNARVELAIDASVPQTHTDPQTHTGLETTHTNLARTGTMQFMAIARLESQAWDGHLQHIYRHDLEAFFYILAWVLCCYEGGQRLNPLPPMLDNWTKCDPEMCSAYKYKFICKAWPRDSLPTDSWSYEMAALANRIRAFFANMLRTCEPSEQSYHDTFKLQLERRNRALPPPKEDDKPTEIWEGFCGTVKKALSNSDQTHLQDLPPRLASFLPDTQMDTPV